MGTSFYTDWTTGDAAQYLYDHSLGWVDQAAAGIADSITSGSSTRFREYMYGEIASQNHEGFIFSAGQATGTAINVGVGFANPCSMSCAMGTATRGVVMIQSAGEMANGVDAIANGDYVEGIASLAGGMAGTRLADQPCFPAGTPLLTPEGSKSIEDFRPGDWILSAPEHDPEAPPEPRRVERVCSNYAPIMALRVGGRTVSTTAEHPFWVRGRGWTAAHQLVPGDHLKAHDGSWMVLEGVENGGEAVPVYNLSVAEYHTYFVGDRTWSFSVWSHNTGNCGSTRHIKLNPADNGSYIVNFSSGMKYVGKGGTGRSRKSAREHSRANSDPVAAIDHTPAASDKEAFLQEAARLDAIGGPSSPGNYNRINSPGVNLARGRSRGPA